MFSDLRISIYSFSLALQQSPVTTSSDVCWSVKLAPKPCIVMRSKQFMLEAWKGMPIFWCPVVCGNPAGWTKKLILGPLWRLRKMPTNAGQAPLGSWLRRAVLSGMQNRSTRRAIGRDQSRSLPASLC